MAVTLKCAACGADVEFEELSPAMEETCPGCEVKVRYREGDQQMAIPVSMNLPEKFQHVDLSSVADKSSLLVGRYRKPSAEAAAPNSDLVLAKALESLANSIGHLEERLSRHERGEHEEDFESDQGSGHGQANGVKVVSDNGGEDGEVVQLEPEEDAKEVGKYRANPVGARLLVRREAARHAHQHRREKHSQADWDDNPERSRGPTGFAWLMKRHPKSTIFVTMALAASLILATILVMNEMFATPGVGPTMPEAIRTTSLSQLMADDPEAAMSETVARGFLNATSAQTAAPFVFESEAIQTKFEKYYRPIPNPGEYDLKLKSRALAPGGQSVFAYRVATPDVPARMLVVLPEGRMPKVFWEFFGEVGEVTWDEFLSRPPKDPVEMRVCVYPGDQYFKPYDRKQWQCYILHDYAEKRMMYAYADRGASGDWRIGDALENEPVQFNRHASVMAHVKLAYIAELPDADASGAIVELKEVISTSWLPERFQTPRKKK